MTAESHSRMECALLGAAMVAIVALPRLTRVGRIVKAVATYLNSVGLDLSSASYSSYLCLSVVVCLFGRDQTTRETIRDLAAAVVFVSSYFRSGGQTTG